MDRSCRLEGDVDVKDMDGELWYVGMVVGS